MPDAPDDRRRPSLFAQIALRLAMAVAAFALLDAALVIYEYAGDRQIMAEDFVRQESARVEQALSRDGARPALSAPAGASAWAYAVVDASGRRTRAGGDPRLLQGLPSLTPTTLDWTHRDRIDRGERITGVQRCSAGPEPCWVVVSAEARGWRIYLPVIGGELMDHVAEPLAPLFVLLLIVNIAVVRRMLAPLAAAAAQVEAFDPRRMEERMSEPAASSREVAALVATINRALDRLQRAMALLKDFTADAAHELRTPLSVLQLRIEALPPGEARDQLRQDVTAMARLVNQMLDLAQADVMSLEAAETVDLAAVAREVVSQLALLAFAKDCDLRLVDQGSARIRGHFDALARVLRNLIENAIAHGGRAGSVDVIVGPGPRIAVRDHGVGLGDADPAALFQRFWRRRRETNGGAGLGLGIVRSIVEAHGGAISAANAPGGGAIFVCTFPAVEPVPTITPAVPPSRSAVAA